jgi:hypothetical protein
VLDGAGDADGDVKLGCHDLASLSHLHVVGHEAGIDSGTRGADGGIEFVGDAFEQFEVLTILHATATGDDDRGLRSAQDGRT